MCEEMCHFFTFDWTCLKTSFYTTVLSACHTLKRVFLYCCVWRVPQLWFTQSALAQSSPLSAGRQLVSQCEWAAKWPQRSCSLINSAHKKTDTLYLWIFNIFMNVYGFLSIQLGMVGAPPISQNVFRLHFTLKIRN